MTLKEKGKKIASIVFHLKIRAIEKNKELVRQGRYNEQEAFNENDTFLSLCFKNDAEINKIYNMIL